MKVLGNAVDEVSTSADWTNPKWEGQDCQSNDGIEYGRVERIRSPYRKRETDARVESNRAKMRKNSQRKNRK